MVSGVGRRRTKNKEKSIKKPNKKEINNCKLKSLKSNRFVRITCKRIKNRLATTVITPTDHLDISAKAQGKEDTGETPSAAWMENATPIDNKNKPITYNATRFFVLLK